MHPNPSIIKKKSLATVVFIINHDQILLATKMKKFGAGLLNDYGGKKYHLIFHYSKQHIVNYSKN